MKHKITLSTLYLFLMLISCISNYHNQSKSTQSTLAQCIKSSIYITYLTEEYFKSRNRWPNTYSGLILFINKIDTLKKYFDSIPTDAKAYYQPITEDSLEIKINLKDQYIWKLFITPRSIRQNDSINVLKNGKIDIKFKLSG